MRAGDVPGSASAGPSRTSEKVSDSDAIEAALAAARPLWAAAGREAFDRVRG